MRRLGYGLATVTILAMFLQVLAGWITDHPDLYDLWTYVLFTGILAMVFLVAGLRGSHSAGWRLLIPAFGTALVAERGVTTLHWVYAGAFVLAAILTQIVQDTQGTPASADHHDDFIDED